MKRTHIVVQLSLEHCWDGCPYCRSDRTKGAGMALDYFCVLMNDMKIVGYVEGEADYVPVPDWCPLVVK